MSNTIRLRLKTLYNNTFSVLIIYFLFEIQQLNVNKAFIDRTIAKTNGGE